MSIYHGSFAVTRYKVLGRQRRLSVPELNQAFKSRQIGHVSLLRHPRELSYGWVLPDNPELEADEGYDTDWGISECLFEDGILLRFRIEKKTVPSQLLQDQVKKRWQELRNHQASETPQRVRRKQVLDDVREELLCQALPSLSYGDAYWKDQEDTLYLFSQSKQVRECFEQLFRDSFGKPHDLSLFRIVPPFLGLVSQNVANEARARELLEKIRRIAPEGPRREVVS